MFLGSPQPRTSRRLLNTLCKSWRPSPAHKHCGSIRSAPPQSCGSLPSNRDCYHSRQRKCRSKDQHIFCRRSWSFETERELCFKTWLLVYDSKRRPTSTKFVCLASRTVTTAWTSSISFCFSSSSKFIYHLANLVFPARFWIRMKRICWEHEIVRRCLWRLQCFYHFSIVFCAEPIQSITIKRSWREHDW